jgi:hypothetical protein
MFKQINQTIMDAKIAMRAGLTAGKHYIDNDITLRVLEDSVVIRTKINGVNIRIKANTFDDYGEVEFKQINVVIRDIPNPLGIRYEVIA